MPPACPADVYAVMQACWDAKPRLRPSFASLVADVTRLGHAALLYAQDPLTRDVGLVLHRWAEFKGHVEPWQLPPEAIVPLVAGPFEHRRRNGASTAAAAAAAPNTDC